MARYIDADKLRDIVCGHCNPYGAPTIDFSSGTKVLDWINCQLIADVVPVKHGKWIKDWDEFGRPLDKCSECYKELRAAGYLYCPYCGALNERDEANIPNQKKAMISQPMAGKTEDEIIADRDRAIAYLESMGYELVNTLFTDEWYSKENIESRGVVNIPLCFLAKSLENMSLCDVAYFVKGWESARGCKVEHEVAVAYGLDVIEEE